ncbi:MAG TPA: hypothetical protein VFV83_08125 [Chthoniobacteraceae bacterium]|nr:hypothetical protein [Chthoniobacteraceae bacterium]
MIKLLIAVVVVSACSIVLSACATQADRIEGRHDFRTSRLESRQDRYDARYSGRQQRREMRSDRADARYSSW